MTPAEQARYVAQLGAADPVERSKAAAWLATEGKAALPATGALVRAFADEADEIAGGALARALERIDAAGVDVIACACATLKARRKPSPRLGWAIEWLEVARLERGKFHGSIGGLP